ncbi:SPOSA6832_00535, partial [Sporobolomyces salmonicolor]
MPPSSAASSPSKTGAHRAFPHLTSASKPQLKDVARLIKEGKAKNVIVMLLMPLRRVRGQAGAGISTGAGIPDFRSPGTGLYDNLAKYNLPYPEAIFDIEYLEERPEAFYTLAKELYPGNFNPTRTHYFFMLLQQKGMLKAVFTQNIDTLERIAGLEDEYVIEAHGSFAEAACLTCRKTYTKEEIKPQIMRGEVVRCQEKGCKGRREALIKPKIVFFGEGLPDKFFERLSVRPPPPPLFLSPPPTLNHGPLTRRSRLALLQDFAECDLLLVLGTSLTVGPFNTLLHRVPASCPRVLINLESVGEASHPWDDGFDFDGLTKDAKRGGVRDVRYLGESDAAVGELAELLGWAEELAQAQEKGWDELERADGEEAERRESAEDRRHEVIEAVEAAVGEKERTSDEEDEAVGALAKGVADVLLDGGDAGSSEEEKNANADTTKKPAL